MKKKAQQLILTLWVKRLWTNCCCWAIDTNIYNSFMLTINITTETIRNASTHSWPWSKPRSNCLIDCDHLTSWRGVWVTHTTFTLTQCATNVLFYTAIAFMISCKPFLAYKSCAFTVYHTPQHSSWRTRVRN